MTNDHPRRYHELDHRVSRSGIPLARQIHAMASGGVHTLIDLTRRPRPTIERACLRAGVRYCKVPLSDTDAVPSESLARVLEILDQGIPIHLHCWSGRHRVGVICAGWRLARGWPHQQAHDEMMRLGFGPIDARPQLYESVFGGWRPDR